MNKKKTKTIRIYYPRKLWGISIFTKLSKYEVSVVFSNKKTKWYFHEYSCTTLPLRWDLCFDPEGTVNPYYVDIKLKNEFDEFIIISKRISGYVIGYY